MTIVAEYAELFPNQGEFSVEVKFETSLADTVKSSMPKRFASSGDIAQFMQLLVSVDQPSMAFDEHHFRIKEFKLDLIKKKLHIRAAKVALD